MRSILKIKILKYVLPDIRSVAIFIQCDFKTNKITVPIYVIYRYRYEYLTSKTKKSNPKRRLLSIGSNRFIGKNPSDIKRRLRFIRLYIIIYTIRDCYY